jgi:hypothetical protein
MKHTEMIMVIEAHSEGKAIECATNYTPSDWYEVDILTNEFNFSSYIYRVKLATKYETRFIDKQNCLWIGDDQGIREGKTYVEIKALREAIAIIDSHYNWSADLRAATLELKELLN